MQGWIYVVIVILVGAALLAGGYFYVNYYNSQKKSDILQIGNFGDNLNSAIANNPITPPIKKCTTCSCRG